MAKITCKLCNWQFEFGPFTRDAAMYQAGRHEVLFHKQAVAQMDSLMRADQLERLYSLPDPRPEKKAA